VLVSSDQRLERLAIPLLPSRNELLIGQSSDRRA